MKKLMFIFLIFFTTSCSCQNFFWSHTEEEWTLLASFENNSPNTTTFDPVITASSGEYQWDLGDGTIVSGKVVSHTYSTTATRTVKLYGKGSCVITAIDFNTDNIVGSLDLSNDAFPTVTSWTLHTNSAMTAVTFPASISATVSIVRIYSTGITGTLDLSKFATFTATANIWVHSNTNMTGVTFAPAITGTIATLYIRSNPALTGILDLSKFATFTATASVQIYGNTAMSGITFAPATIAGFVHTLLIYGCTSLGYIDLTKLPTGVAALDWQFQNNGWSAAVVNQVLVDTDGISDSGFANRIINIGGTNADPTTGPPDGVAARTSLQGKGFTVTI